MRLEKDKYYKALNVTQNRDIAISIKENTIGIYLKTHIYLRAIQHGGAITRVCGEVDNIFLVK